MQSSDQEEMPSMFKKQPTVMTQIYNHSWIMAVKINLFKDGILLISFMLADETFFRKIDLFRP